MREQPDWFARAACLGMDPAWFYPSNESIEHERAAKAICAACPVRTDCLNHAIDTREAFGIWGGMSERQRRKIRGQRWRAGDGSQPCRICGLSVERKPAPRGGGHPLATCEDCKHDLRLERQRIYYRTRVAGQI